MGRKKAGEDNKVLTDLRREYYNSWTHQQAIQHRDIGAIPEIKDPARRAAGQHDLKFFLETYFPGTFHLAWSAHHIKLLELMQRAILEGLQQAIGFPRASGKTTIAQRAVLWATLHGHRQFAMLFAAEDLKSRQHTRAIWNELARNELLLEDFPEVCFPLSKTDGNAIRASRQLCLGQETQVEISKLGIIYPTVPESVARGNAGAIIGLGTITGSASRGPIMRGIRPDLALVDDPQTRKSAKSPVMVRERINSIIGDILGMAGPGLTVATLMTCTVIYREDLADQLLDRSRHPEWYGIRVKMLESPPTRIDLWDEWAGLIREAQLNEESYDKAHAFYLEHRAEMDDGSQVYWEARKLKGFASALESAMFLRYRDPTNFASEYQNEPETLADEDESLPGVEVIRKQVHHCRRRIVPTKADLLTCFVDVQQKVLFYSVVAWERDSFTGYVIDYGTWPDQKRPHFTKSDVKVTIGHQMRGSGWDACLRHALEQLVGGYLTQPFQREDGTEMRIERGLIDANWHESTDVVYTYLKHKRLTPTWLPSHGIYIRAASLSDDKKRIGEKRGQHWKLTRQSQYNINRVIFDSNYWKSFHAARWRTVVGDPGTIYLYATRDHELFAEHMTAETGTLVESKGKRITEWTSRGQSDNDWLDCMVGNCVAASILGCRVRSIEPMIDTDRPKRARITSDNVAALYG